MKTWKYTDSTRTIVMRTNEQGQMESGLAEFLVGEDDVVDAPDAPAFDREAAMQRLRDQRRPILDALSGVAGRLQRKGKTDEATAADTAAQALLDLTAHPMLATPSNDHQFDKTALYLYRMIAVQCPASVQSAFMEAV